VELVGLALEAVLVGSVGVDVPGVAAAGAVEGGVDGGEEQQGEVGLECSADGVVEGENLLAAELAASALVGLGGVGETIAEDDVAGGQCGLDDLGDGLGTVGEHQGELGDGGDGAEGGLGTGVENDAAD